MTHNPLLWAVYLGANTASRLAREHYITIPWASHLLYQAHKAGLLTREKLQGPAWTYGLPWNSEIYQ